MDKHRGKILSDVLYKWCERSGWSIVALSRKVGYNPSSTYRHFEKEDLSFHIIAKYGKAIGHDFRDEFPELDEEYGYVNHAAEPHEHKYEPLTLSQAIQQIETWKNKYYDLLEKHNKLLMEKLEGAGSK